jgi:hypothetical protein
LAKVKDRILPGALLKYSGSVNDAGKPHGLGELTVIKKGHPDEGRVFIGQLEDGEIHGYGELRYADGTRKLGQFEKSKLCGVAEVWRSSEDVYRGQFMNNKRHGWGHQKLDGIEWMGNFRPDEGAIVRVSEKGSKREVQYWRDKMMLSSNSGLLQLFSQILLAFLTTEISAL